MVRDDALTGSTTALITLDLLLVLLSLLLLTSTSSFLCRCGCGGGGRVTDVCKSERGWF